MAYSVICMSHTVTLLEALGLYILDWAKNNPRELPLQQMYLEL
ncbi:hypothetical protein [Vibrio gallaecicus]|nr:hypothetical protein [Vibrio gallaecicus]MDN3616883.1 hypothetical protein [Vibrio gallaecicus]